MAQQKVTEKILEDARKEAQEILDRFKEEAKGVNAGYEKRIADKKTQIEADVAASKENEIMRALSQNRLEFSKKVVRQKRAFIDDIIDDALKKIHEHKEYVHFLKTLINKSGEKDGELLLNKQDVKRYGAELEKFIKKEGLRLKMKGDNEISGGLIIKKGKTAHLGSLDIISELLGDELTIAISRVLY
jgi:V/A-type H+-transporting ATPase subunit E